MNQQVLCFDYSHSNRWYTLCFISRKNLHLPQKIWSAADVFKTETTTETVATEAIGGVKLQDCLCVGSIFCLDSSLSPATDNAVGFGLQRFQQAEGVLCQCFITLVTGITEKHGRHGIDEEQFERRVGKQFVTRRRLRRMEVVMGAPIITDMSLQQILHFFRSVGLEQTGKVEPTFMVQHG